MTRLLLSCDDYVYCHNSKYYTKPSLMPFYQRYLRVFDKIRLVLRCREESILNDNRVPIESNPNLEVVPLPFFQGPRGYAKVYFQVGKTMRDAVQGCDAAVLRIPSTVALRVGKLVKAADIPYACEVVFDAQDGWQGEHGIARLLWKKIDRDMRYLCAGADGVSCVTEHYLQQHYFPIKDMAFTSHYSSLALPKEFYGSAKLYPNHSPFVIAHTANQVQFNGRKGFNQIIDSLCILKKRGVKVKVRFAGEDYDGGIEKLSRYAEGLGVRDMIEFEGFLSRKKLDTFLSESDLYVMPTTAEGLPRVIIEAMAKGLPCISTPVSGNPELVEGHFLVDYNDVKTLADRIEELVTNKSLYEATSNTNFENSLKYEATVLQSRRDDFYNKLLERVRR